MIRVTVERGGGEPAEQLTVQGEISIGCVAGRDILLEDPRISRLHAIVYEENGDCTVVDREGLDGTVIGGYPVVPNEPTPWRPGEAMVIRGYTLWYGPPVDEDPSPRLGAEPVVEFVPMVRAERPPEEAAVGILRTELLRERPLISRWSSGAATLVVRDILRETQDAFTFCFGDEDPRVARHEPFQFEPGQAVELTFEVDGRRVRRTCSLSSSPSRPLSLEITVQRAPGEPASAWLPERLRIGDRVQVGEPGGEFCLFRHPSAKVLLLAGGVGIAPLMSMLRWIVDVSAPVDVVVFYSVRTMEDVIFARELESIHSRFPRVSITVTSTSPRMPTHGFLGLRGRIDRAKLEAVVPDLREREAFVSGPPPFMAAMEELLLELGLAEDRLHRPAPSETRALAIPDGRQEL